MLHKITQVRFNDNDNANSDHTGDGVPLDKYVQLHRVSKTNHSLLIRPNIQINKLEMPFGLFVHRRVCFCKLNYEHIITAQLNDI